MMRFTSWMLSAAVSLPACTAAPLFAQDAISPDAQLADIVVSAQRRDQSLQDVPISITAFSREALEKQGVDQLSDYLQATPNTFFRQAGGPRFTELSIRGVSTNIQSLTGSSFGFYLDELNIAPSGQTGAVDLDLIDIERVEVLRGPQGTLFGRNASGGAINVTTTKPTYEFGGYVRGQIARFNETRLGGAINVPIVDGKLAIRAAGEIRRGGEFIENIGPGNGNARDYNSMRIAVRAEPTETLLIDVSYSRLDTSQGAYDAVPTGVLSGYVSSFIEEPVLGGLDVYPRNKSKIATNDSFRNHVVSDIFTAKIQAELGDVTLSSITGYIKNNNKSEGDIDYSIEDWFKSIAGDKFDSWSQEVRVAYRPSERLLLSAGYIYARDNVLNYGSEIAKSLGAAIYDQIAQEENAPVGSIGSGDIWFNYRIGSRNRSHGLFAEAVWQATDQLTLTLGARQTWDQSAPYGFNDFLGFVDTFATVQRNFSAFTPRLVAQYAVSEDSNVYGSVSTGYKAGGTDVFATLQGFPGEYGAEKLTSYEIGTKNLFFDRRLAINLSAFILDWRDIQVEADVLLPDSGFSTSIVQNAGRARVEGFEAELVGRVTEGLTLQGGVGYLNGKFTDLPALITDTGTVDLTGERLPDAPEWTVNASAEHGWALFGGNVFVRGEVIHNSGWVEEVFPRSSVPAYTIANFRAGYNSDRLSITAFIENAFDSDYYTSVFDQQGGSYFSGALRQIIPMRFGLTARTSF